MGREPAGACAWSRGSPQRDTGRSWKHRTALETEMQILALRTCRLGTRDPGESWLRITSPTRPMEGTLSLRWCPELGPRLLGSAGLS